VSLTGPSRSPDRESFGSKKTRAGSRSRPGADSRRGVRCLPLGCSDRRWTVPHCLSACPRSRGCRSNRCPRFGRPGVGRWSAGWRRISRRVLRLLRALSQLRSGELPASGIYGHSSRRRLCRNDDREGERPRVDPERSLVGRCGAAALRRPHNLQRAAKRAGEGWRSRCQAFESLCQRRRGSRSTGAMMKDPNPMAADQDGGQRTGALHAT
jgi:hypothetical protein